MKPDVAAWSPEGSGLHILSMTGAACRVPAHTHASWCLVLVTRGERRIGLTGGVLALVPGAAALVPPLLAHTCVDVPPGCDALTVSFTAEAARKAGLEGLPHAGRARLVRAGEALSLLLRMAVSRDDHLAKRFLAALADDARTADVLPGGRCSSSLGVRRAAAALDATDGLELTLPRLADEAGVSPSHLARCFTRDMGLPMTAYRTLSRLRRARTLLDAGLDPAEAAAESGFYDQSHLNLGFKRYMGMTPGQYRRGRA